MVHMELFAVLLLFLRVPDHEGVQESGPKNVGLENAEFVVLCGQVEHQLEQQKDQNNKHKPEPFAPRLHDTPLKREVLHRATVSMRKVAAEDESRIPPDHVVLENLPSGVDLAHGFNRSHFQETPQEISPIKQEVVREGHRVT